MLTGTEEQKREKEENSGRFKSMLPVENKAYLIAGLSTVKRKTKLNLIEKCYPNLPEIILISLKK